MLLPHPHPDSLHVTYSMWMKDSAAAIFLLTIPQHLVNQCESRITALIGDIPKCVRQQ